jgi:hypothetical protein
VHLGHMLRSLMTKKMVKKSTDFFRNVLCKAKLKVMV